MIVVKTIAAIVLVPVAVTAIVACAFAWFIGHIVFNCNRRAASLNDFEEDYLFFITDKGRGRIVQLDETEYKICGN